MISGFVGLVELLGIPKPASLDLTDSATKDAKVLATSVREGEVVYIWVQPTDSDGWIQTRSATFDLNDSLASMPSSFKMA